MVDVWQHGSAYDRFMGRWSRLVAPEFLDWLDAGPGLRWADVGCGSGALTATILDRCSPVSVVGIDPAGAQVEEAGRRVVDPRARFSCGTVDALEPGAFDVVVSGLVVNFIADPISAVDTMGQLAPHGTVAAYVWDYEAGMQMLRVFWDTARSLDASAAALDEGRRFTFDTSALSHLWASAGLTRVETTAITVTLAFPDFDDFWTPFLGGQGPAPTYVTSLEQDAREALRAALEQRLSSAADGSITLTARALAVRGHSA